MRQMQYEFRIINEDDAEQIIRWNEDRDADFLLQWAGSGFTCPITKEQIMADAAQLSRAVYAILYQTEVIGTIALVRADENTGEGYIGHFLLNPEKTGQGHGTASLHAFMQYCFGVLKLKELSLRVFTYNISALRCYEKNGFVEIERSVMDNGWIVLLMNVKKEKEQSTSDTPIEICEETEADRYAAEAVTQRAFWNLHEPGCSEHLLVANLRRCEAYMPKLSKIAKLNGQVVGTIMYSKAYVEASDGTRHEVLTFGPLSVEPEYQNLGIGGRLLRTTMEEARQAGYPAIIIFGEPYYYPRFGFQTCDHFGITTSEGKNFDAFMAYELQPGALKTIQGKFYEDKVFEDLPSEDVEKMNEKFPALVKLHLPGQWV